MSRRVLVAGIGNIFLGDDGFGVEVAQRLLRESFPEGVRVADFGIRGLHLAYELLDGYDLAILIDAAPRGGVPGTLYVIEPDLEEPSGVAAAEAPALDGHGMDPVAVLAMARTLGGDLGRILFVGCEPAEIEERIGLSEPIAGVVEDAVRVVRELVAAEVSLVAAGAAGSR